MIREDLFLGNMGDKSRKKKPVAKEDWEMKGNIHKYHFKCTTEPAKS